MALEPPSTAADIRHRIWTELQRATVDRHHEWRTPVLATSGLDGLPQARTVVLRAADATASQRVGFKPSGGIRTVAEAATYMAMHCEALGPQALTPRRFRIGASSILGDIEAILGGNMLPANAPTGSY